MYSANYATRPWLNAAANTQTHTKTVPNVWSGCYIWTYMWCTQFLFKSGLLPKIFARAAEARARYTMLCIHYIWHILHTYMRIECVHNFAELCWRARTKKYFRGVVRVVGGIVDAITSRGMRCQRHYPASGWHNHTAKRHIIVTSETRFFLYSLSLSCVVYYYCIHSWNVLRSSYIHAHTTRTSVHHEGAWICHCCRVYI